jgi:hypothetical protein
VNRTSTFVTKSLIKHSLTLGLQVFRIKADESLLNFVKFEQILYIPDDKCLNSNSKISLPKGMHPLESLYN